MDDGLLACVGVVVVEAESKRMVKDRTFIGWGGKHAGHDGRKKGR